MVKPAAEPGEQEATAYEVHIAFPRAIQEKLKKSAELAYKLGLIPKPKLAELMNLYIGWGMNVLKTQYLKRMGQG
jgi:hypothetical protein